MKRFVLRFRGTGAKPTDDVARIHALPRLTVLDEASSRMMLIEAPESDLFGLMRSLPMWVVCREEMIPVPDLRKEVRSGR